MSVHEMIDGSLNNMDLINMLNKNKIQWFALTRDRKRIRVFVGNGYVRDVEEIQE